jgi:hypothetical protein
MPHNWRTLAAKRAAGCDYPSFLTSSDVEATFSFLSPSLCNRGRDKWEMILSNIIKWIDGYVSIACPTIACSTKANSNHTVFVVMQGFGPRRSEEVILDDNLFDAIHT